MELLTRLDEIRLWTVWKLKDNAYGVPIIREVQKTTGKRLSPGALWVSMDNLSKRKYIIKRLAQPTSEIGGRGKLYYSITPDGIKALERVRALHHDLWEGIPGIIHENA